jgi:hypothetical protein
MGDEPANDGPAKYEAPTRTGGLCAVRTPGSPLGWPLMVDAHRRDCSLTTDKDAACTLWTLRRGCDAPPVKAPQV